MHVSTKARLVHLNAKASRHLTEFAKGDKEESHTLRNAAVAAGTAGVGYAGLSALRGGLRMKAEYGSGPSSLKQLLTATKIGHGMNTGDAQKGIGAVRQAYGKAGQSAVLAARDAKFAGTQVAQSASNAARSAGRTVSGATTSAVGATKAALGQVKSRLMRGRRGGMQLAVR